MPSHPFIVGEQYFDRRGSYEVLEITRDNIRIRHEDGRETVSSIGIKARIYANILVEGRALHPHQSAAYFRTLGFLAGSGEFHAEVPRRSQAPFEEKYRNMTGYRPGLHEDKYFLMDTVTNYDKWGPELRIYLPDRDDVEFPPGVELRSGRNPGTVRINNNNYWWQLVRVGFRLGTGHEVEHIRESVPLEFQADFDEGLGA